MNKRLCLISLVSFIVTLIANAQVDSHGNPIFNSILVQQDTLDGYMIATHYYTMRNNVDNKNSSVYVDDNPSLDELLEFARTKPSYFFVVHRNQVVAHIIVQLSEVKGTQSVYSYLVINPNTKKQVELSSQAGGQITEARAVELLKNGYDPSAERVPFGNTNLCAFNGLAYSIQPLASVQKEVFALVKEHKLFQSNIDLDEIDD